MSHPLISIVILNYNTKDLLIQCVESLIKVKDEVPFEIIVCDNGSTDDSIQALGEIDLAGVNLKIILNNSNLGFAKGNNAARDDCAGEYVLFLNSDTIVNKDVLRQS